MLNISGYNRIFAAAILLGSLASCNKHSATLDTLKDSETIAVLPCDASRSIVTISPDIRARIDFGKVHNLISHEDLQLLKDLDYNIDSTLCLSVTHDLKGDVVVRTRRYSVDLPIWKWNTTSDSLGNVTVSPVGNHPVNVIYGVNFILAPEGEMTTIGLDLLRNTVVEYRYDDNMLAISTQVPEGYQEVGTLQSKRRIDDFICTKERYYINLSVNNLHYDFLVSTANGDSGLKMPLDESLSGSDLDKVEVHMGVNNANGLCDSNGWVEFGDRAGTYPVYYYNDESLPSEYIFNPIFFFQQNSVADFRNEKFYLYPHVNRRQRMSAIKKHILLHDGQPTALVQNQNATNHHDGEVPIVK